MKILMSVHGYPPKKVGGTEIYTHDLAQALSEKHEVAVVVRGIGNYDKSTFKTKSKDGPVKLYTVFENKNRGEKTTFHNKDLELLFTEILDDFKPDICHFQYLGNLSFGFIGVAKSKKIPVIVGVSDYFPLCSRYKLIMSNGTLCTGPEEGHKCGPCRAPELNAATTTTVSPSTRFIATLLPQTLVNWLYTTWTKATSKQDTQAFTELFVTRNSYIRQELKRADVIHCISNYVKEKLIAWGISTTHVKTIEWGYDATFIPAANPTLHKPIRFGFMGNLMKEKGIETFLRAASGIADAHFYIYGGGDGRYSAELKKRFSQKNIFFMGSYNHETVQEVLAQFDVLVIPSEWQETLGIVAMEGILAKKVLIVSDIEAYKRWVTHQKNGLVYPQGDSTALKQQIEWMTEHQEKIKQFAKHHPPVKTMRSHAIEIENLYNSVLRK